MNKELIKRYVDYLNEVIKTEEDPNEADILECKRNDLLDILEENNAYVALEKLALYCPDEEIVGEYECLGARGVYSCFHCEECWKRILNI